MTSKIDTLLCSVVLMLLMASSVVSAELYKKSEHKDKFGHHGNFNIVEALDLTSEQEEKFRDIMQAQRSEREVWRKKQHQEAKMKLRTVLTEEQMKKFQALKEQKAHNAERAHPRHF